MDVGSFMEISKFLQLLANVHQEISNVTVWLFSMDFFSFIESLFEALTGLLELMKLTMAFTHGTMNALPPVSLKMDVDGFKIFQ